MRYEDRLDVHRVRLVDIKIGNRWRESIGDLTELKQSMTENGQIQPILVDGNSELIAGGRRLQAAKDLGWEKITTYIVPDLDMLIDGEQMPYSLSDEERSLWMYVWAMYVEAAESSTRKELVDSGVFQGSCRLNC